jgi:voltage-gated potassium channel
MPLRHRTWEIVEVAKPGDAGSRAFDSVILTLIVLNVLAVVIGSVQAVEERFGWWLNLFEAVSVAVFTFEYAARIWSCTADPAYSRPVTGRLRFMVRPMPLIDLLAIVPFYLPFFGVDLRSLRVLRLLRILRIAKLGRYYSSLNVMKDVIVSRKEELVLTTSLMGLLLVISSSVLYYCENAAQPEVFSSIPATMWWGVATLTTVGYGDVAPVTAAGRAAAGVFAVVGIGMFALPTGILGAGFVEAIEQSKKPAQTCPHCGKPLA